MSRLRSLLVLAVVALPLAACSGTGGLFGGGQDAATAQAPQAAGQGANPVNPVSNAVFGQPIAANAPVTLNDGICPRIEVRDGSNVWRQGGEGPTEVRFQATITDLARECRIEGNQMVIRVGVEGRLVLGPKGGPGQVNMPIRIALARGLSESIWTRLYQVGVQVPPGSPNVAFTQVEDGLVIPLPTPEELSRMIIFVGFDNLAPQRPEQRGRRRGA
ncbi:MAG: hypothetical protein WCH83_16850 [Alphaproteobacteria bacterium]